MRHFLFFLLGSPNTAAAKPEGNKTVRLKHRRCSTTRTRALTWTCSLQMVWSSEESQSGQTLGHTRTDRRNSSRHPLLLWYQHPSRPDTESTKKGQKSCMQDKNLLRAHTCLHKPVVRRSFIHDVYFALHIIELHVFTIIHEHQLQGVWTFSQHRVNPALEPVGVKHFSMRVLPQRRDPVG